MTPGLVYIVEQDPTLRKVLTGVAESAGGSALCFNSLADARRDARHDRPSLLIAPWSDGAETAIAMRSVMGFADDLPHLLVMTDTPTAAKIALAQRAGRTEVIPTDPLDQQALANRIVMTLFGADALMRFIGVDDLPSELDAMPSLRRLFAA